MKSLLKETTWTLLPPSEADKGGVRHFDQDVVHAVHVDELDAPPLHVVRDALVPQSPVETAVPDELALVVHGGQHALLEEDDVVLLQAKLLELHDAFGLDLEEGLVGRQPHVVHAFGVRDPQPGALAPGQQQDGHFALRDAAETWRRAQRREEQALSLSLVTLPSTSRGTGSMRASIFSSLLPPDASMAFRKKPLIS
ncbi:hypothetical protein EYF80_023004 [Liparis tanakae]|uniref:Uncharacterized protein n=1 Tax=Liparis tanakae TaxID=230148 RepID=A0A4Z2HPR2_9TELE|nr:hypothetical protein EYF80_023004 [Liparis tanakae]